MLHRRRRRISVARAVVPGLGLLAMFGAAVAVVVDNPAADPAESALASTNVLAVAEASPPTTVSRDAERPPLPNDTEIEALITDLRYAKKKTAIRADSDPDSPKLATVKFRDSVDVTGKESGDWTQIMHKGAPRWVASKDLAVDQPPVPEPPLGTVPCPTGSERGLQPDTVKVLRAVCAKFPEISSYGGLANRGEHATGQALDIMNSTAVGNQVAEFLMANRAELGIEYLIWRQRIWRPSTSGAWRGMSDRGSATANHMDHVHVTTYGNSASS
ncbi:MAG: SH3 domain-containing protein [Aeromicrobium sp.]